jgi:DNA-binding NarL/FixJ family response regulator
MTRIKVLLADDHTMVRQGLRALLQTEPDIEISGEAESGRRAVQLTRELKPEVVVMDVAMPQLNGLEATRQILRNCPGIRILVLSSYSDDEYIEEFTRCGAAGYLLKQAAATDLVRAIREIRCGRTFFSPTISKRLVEGYRRSLNRGGVSPRLTNLLTSRELEVLQLIAEGNANKQIAAELGISIKTVEKHRQQLMNKLNIHETAGLTRYAVSRGIVQTRAVSRAV